jgi:hypothetical protein
MASAAFRFHQLLGQVYHQGNLVFTADGNTVVSPVGNRVAAFDLVKCVHALPGAFRAPA